MEGLGQQVGWTIVVLGFILGLGIWMFAKVHNYTDYAHWRGSSLEAIRYVMEVLQAETKPSQ